MRLLTEGFEFGDAQSPAYAWASSGTHSGVPAQGTIIPARDTPNGGQYALAVANPNTGALSYYAIALPQRNVLCVRIYWKHASAPLDRIVGLGNLIATQGVYLERDGTAIRMMASGVEVGRTEIENISTDRWYRIEMMVSASGGNAEMIAVLIEGQFVGLWVGSQACGTFDYLHLYGNVDDVAVNDATGAEQNTFAGAGVVRMIGDAAVSANTFLGGDAYAESVLNARPLGTDSVVPAAGVIGETRAMTLTYPTLPSPAGFDIADVRHRVVLKHSELIEDAITVNTTTQTVTTGTVREPMLQHVTIPLATPLAPVLIQVPAPTGILLFTPDYVAGVQQEFTCTQTWPYNTFTNTFKRFNVDGTSYVSGHTYGSKTTSSSPHSLIDNTTDAYTNGWWVLFVAPVGTAPVEIVGFDGIHSNSPGLWPNTPFRLIASSGNRLINLLGGKYKSLAVTGTAPAGSYVLFAPFQLTV